jgi:hypothetical protein
LDRLLDEAIPGMNDPGVIALDAVFDFDSGATGL